MKTSFLLALALAVGAISAQAAGIQPLRAIAQPGGTIAPGTYACRQQYNASSYTYKVVEITSASAYAYKGSQSYPGKMKYDAASGKIEFTSGKLAASRPCMAAGTTAGRSSS